MSDLTYYTAEGLKKLKDELFEMETVQRPSISAQIGEAIDKGDLSENAEYDAAKETQGIIETKIAKLKNIIANGRIIDDSNIDSTKVFILSTARIRNVENDQEMTFTIVAENEADLKKKKISIDSPFGKGLLGKSVGDVANIVTPGGEMKFEVLEITR
ncbi:MAG: transcription elongation factor GreA [Crocinitomicaceae bacterium]|jgi:transcription elongation factor GreA|nr:transcription elongation factor GreA [Crocinitomicaceae bacterium]MDC1384446.1 transcription elongation factor GreA [Crocinitomicaceae bacterium]|tara:strand:- start:1350 stop:1823 length:474 start_codon:yes stop_codon:yes gene_type:complete